MINILFYAEDLNFFNTLSHCCDDTDTFNLTKIEKLKDLENYSKKSEYNVVIIQSFLKDDIELNTYRDISELFVKYNREVKFLLIIDNIRKVIDHPELKIDNVIEYPSNNEMIKKALLSFFENTEVKKTILMIEDTKFVHSYVKRELEPLGYIIVSAYDGAEGLEKAIEIRPNLIITDIEMPIKDGFQMCKEIKQISFLKNIPVIVLSALDSKDDIKRGFDAGCDDYLTKPFKSEVLLSRMDMFLKDTTIFGRETILVVDDSVIIREMITRNLKKQGFKVIQAKNGIEGLYLAINEKPSIIITDWEMPEMGGIEMSKMLSKNNNTKDIPIIMLSGKDSKDDVIQCYMSGIVSFVSKPFTPDSILVLVERAAAELRFNREKKMLSHYVSDAAIKEAHKRANSKNKNETLYSASESIAVLFSDIAHFTDLSESLGTTAIVALLNDYFDCMTEILREECGDVDKFIGDAIMASFFNKDKMEHACIRAAKTAIRMIGALDKFNEGREQPVHIRIGINFGNVIIGDIGSKYYRRDFTVIGDNVNLASRLEGTNKEYGTQIIISESTKEALDSTLPTRKLDRIRVKGKKIPVNIYELITERSKIKDINDYEAGLEYYFQREWVKAISHFENIMDDHAAQLMLKRCKSNFSNGVNEEWDGVHIMTSK